MNLDAYLQRIGFRGRTDPDFALLTALMRAHVCSVPFENLDVQLGRRLTMSPEAAYEKIVERRRGGWCYEQNGLFGRVLAELGYGVTRMAGAVREDLSDDACLNNHLLLAVTCPGDDTTWLVDVGFGGSHFGPLQIHQRRVFHEPYELQLERLPGGRWRFTESHLESPMHYDFVDEPADEAALAAKCADLQTNPESGFVLNLVAQRRTPTAHHILRGRLLSERVKGRARQRRLESADELVQTLKTHFDLDVPEAASLWPRIVARHTALGFD